MGASWWALEKQVCNTNAVVSSYQAGYQFEIGSYFYPPKGRYVLEGPIYFLKSNKPKRKRIIHTNMVYG
jgi:hypothetical protein